MNFLRLSAIRELCSYVHTTMSPFASVHSYSHALPQPHHFQAFTSENEGVSLYGNTTL